VKDTTDTKDTKGAKDTKERAFGLAWLLGLCVFTLAAAGGPSRHERALAHDLDRIFTAPVMQHGVWGVEVKSLDSGRVLYARNPQTLMMPASNMKILTLAAAAETLGWDYRFKTTLAASAAVEGGALQGDLFVVGGGDPTINSRGNRAAAVFDEWAAALKRAGITRIDGNVIADGSAFEAQGLGQGWSWDYLQDSYAAPVSALEYNENTAALSIRPGSTNGDQAWLELPPGTGLGLIHHLVTGAAGTPTSIAISRDAGEKWLDVTGSIAVDAQPTTRDVAVANPSLYFAHALTRALIDRGISVRGLPRDGPGTERRPLEPGPRRVLVESVSPPLREIATTMMKVSQNLYAETLLKAVGAATSGRGSADAGRSAVACVFSSWGIGPDRYVQADGSGLSRYDYVTPDLIVTLLEHLFKDPRHKDAFIATLPIAGRDGTIASRLKHTRAESNVTAKTGSISNARALSGYVHTRDGETLAFSILANSFAIPAATVNYVTDAAVETLANYSAR
jgi:D-alanyl-D-alanine carboxypeptidase/D-alanyl-D-alanine-endopeptidase (penicillin-binding protein 4)